MRKAIPAKALVQACLRVDKPALIELYMRALLELP